MTIIDRSSIAKVPVKKVSGSEIVAADDIVAVEEPLGIRLTWRVGDIGYERLDLAVTMRTPGADEELALGFLYTEGIITSLDEIRRLGPDDRDPNVMVVELQAEPAAHLRNQGRNFFVTSSCGICGKASLEAIHTRASCEVRGDDLRVPADLLAGLPEMLLPGQSTFAGTGSVHAAVLFAGNGVVSEVYEDVGRHNAVDKLLGACLRDGRLPLWNTGLFVSGRSSFELVQKARMAGCAMLAAVGAPSSLAVDLAWESDMTLVGFVRDGRFNIYAGPARIA